MDKSEGNSNNSNNATNEANMDDAVLNVAAAATAAPAVPAPAGAGTAAMLPQPASASTFVVFRWNDSFMCFESALLNEFLYPPPNRRAMKATDTRFIIWNDRQSVCRLVPFSALRDACRRPTPDTAFLSHKNKETLIWDLAATIFPSHIEEWRSRNYRMVGALDSHSPSSTTLERHLILVHRLNVPMDMFQKALGETLRIVHGSGGARSGSSDPSSESSPHPGTTDPAPAPAPAGEEGQQPRPSDGAAHRPASFGADGGDQ